MKIGFNLVCLFFIFSCQSKIDVQMVEKEKLIDKEVKEDPSQKEDSIEAKRVFISKWEVLSYDEEVILPFDNTQEFSIEVDWGDGTSVEVFKSIESVVVSHTYLNPGEYIIEVSGSAKKYGFLNSGDKEKIIEVLKFDDLGWVDLEGAFYGCTNLISVHDISLGESLLTIKDIFRDAISLEEVAFNNINTINLINTNKAFYNVSRLEILDLDKFNTAKVEDMSLMFSGMSSLVDLKIANFDTGNVQFMAGMFNNVASLSILNLNHFNTSRVSDMTTMFSSMSSLEELEISNFDTSNVESMVMMFGLCPLLTYLDLSHFDVSNVKFFGQIFMDSPNLNIDANGWSLDSVLDSNLAFFLSDSAVVFCDQGGSPGTGTLFGKSCD